MSLINHNPDNRMSAALSIAMNRASKIDLLLASGNADLAQSNANHLMHDVLEFIDDGDGLLYAKDAQALAGIAMNANARVREAYRRANAPRGESTLTLMEETEAARANVHGIVSSLESGDGGVRGDLNPALDRFGEAFARVSDRRSLREGATS